MRRIVSVLLLVPLLTAVVGISGAAAQEDPDFRIAHPTVDPYGASYETWTQRYFQWIFGTPLADNPIVEPGCDNLVGRIWYLPHTFVGNQVKLHCTISDRTPILLSAGGTLCDSGDMPGLSSALLRACASNEFDELSNFRVWVDGVRIHDLEQWIFTTSFSIRYPEGNIFDEVPGTYRAAGKAYMLMLRPLSPGRHTVIVHDEFEGDAARVTAFLKVVSRR